MEANQAYTLGIEELFTNETSVFTNVFEESITCSVLGQCLFAASLSGFSFAGGF